MTTQTEKPAWRVQFDEEAKARDAMFAAALATKYEGWSAREIELDARINQLCLEVARLEDEVGLLSGRLVSATSSDIKPAPGERPVLSAEHVRALDEYLDGIEG